MVQFIKNRLKSVKHAIDGIQIGVYSELHCKMHFIAACIVVIAAIALNVTRTDWLWILLGIGLVISAELFNTAIERLADAVDHSFNPLIKQAKDTAAGAVLWIGIIVILMGCIVFWPYVINLFIQ